MARLQWNLMWLWPVHSLSPMQTLDRMEKRTQVTAISGANDPVTPPEYAHNYIAKAKSRGVSASMIILANKGHEILDDPAVIKEVSRAVQ